MDNIRAKLRRKLSMKDQQADFDDHEEADEETTGYLHKEIEEAETAGHAQGRPGSFLNRLISHGNKKTEDQILKENEESSRAALARNS